MDPVSLTAERIERAALADLHAAASPDLREDLGLRLEEVGGVLVSLASRDPSRLLNRAIGFGIGAPATAETLDAVRDLYASSGIASFYLHLHPEAMPPGARQILIDAGFTKGRGWQKFVRGPEPPAETASDLRVKRASDSEARALGAILARSFGFTDPCADLLAAVAGRPGWHHFVTLDGEELAGGGVLFVQGDAAWFDSAATHPDFRKRGSQGLVLRERTRAARELGCRHLFTATGEAVEGDPQHSYRNILRAGFEPLYLRENWLPPA